MNLMQVIRQAHNERVLSGMRKHAYDNGYDRQDVDKKQLSTLDKYQLRYLKKYVCWGCDMPLDRAGCGCYGGAPPCSWRARARRRIKCLANYKPRLNRRANEN